MATAIPPVGSADAPKYWMQEVSGKLSLAVDAFLNARPMTLEQIVYMRAYIRQWVMSPVWDMNPHDSPQGRADLARLRSNVDVLVNRETISAWLRQAGRIGIDPL